MRLFAIIALAAIIITACTNNSPERDQKLNENWGANLYKTRCANCHQENGAGLANLYPPIAQVRFFNRCQSQKSYLPN
jgi:cytochrome c